MEKIAKLLRSHEHFLLTTHALPDGDGLGSEMALHLYLRKCGKKSMVINPSPTPLKFSLVDPKQRIRVFQPGTPLPKTDVVFVMDTHEMKLLGDLEQPIRQLKCPIVFVDHHVPEIDDVDNHLIDEQFGSTGELVYSFLRTLRADIDAEMALAIYVAIVTDTNGFRFKRTTARSHEIAAELLKKGVLPERVFHQIYARDTFAKIRLLGRVLEEVQSSPDRKIAWITIPKSLREEYEATIEDTEAYVGHLTLIEGVQIAMLFREEDDGRVKVSLRGNEEVPVFGIAKKFGGGGHRHAAGARVKGKLPEVIQLFFDEAKLVLEEQGKK